MHQSMRFIWNELLSPMVKRRAQAHQDTKTAAMNDLRCGSGCPPSWLGNSDRLEEFLSGVSALSSSRDVPPAYVLHVLENEGNYRRLVSYAGALEARKANFAAQQLAIADLILEWWFSHVRTEAIMSEIAPD
jgi:hypothetical protein